MSKEQANPALPEVWSGDLDDILNTAEVCRILGCQPRTVGQLIREGWLRGKEPGHGGFRVTRRALVEYLEADEPSVRRAAK